MNSPSLLKVAFECGLVMCLISGGYLTLVLRLWPRVFLRRYPIAIRNAVEPLTTRERKLGFVLTAPFLISLIGSPAWASYRVLSSDSTYTDLFLAAYLTWTVFNFFDWLVLDEFVVGYLRPSWLVLPGTEHIPLFFDHKEHAIAFVKGAIGGLVLCGLIAATIVVVSFLVS